MILSAMSKMLVSQNSASPAPEICLFGDAVFALGRVHEICGPSRFFMALRLAAKTGGVILWIKPEWSADQLLPAGVVEILDPARLMFVNTSREADILWSMEEALRSGVAPTVIGQINAPLSLTPVRRLLLSAESGAKRGDKPALTILLTPGKGGTQGVETRWHTASILNDNGHMWRLTRTKSRQTPVGQWLLDNNSFQTGP